MGRLYGLALFLLPRRVRQEWGAAMRSAFEAGFAEARSRGPGAATAWCTREMLGLMRTAYRSRVADVWTRRTRPVAGRDGHRERGEVGMTMETLVGDVRFALRTIARRPAVAVLSVLTLSLGLGASTAMFSVVRSVLIEPLPYPEADRLVSVYPGWPEMRGHPTLGHMAERGTWSWPELFEVAGSQSVFELFAGFEPRGLTLTGDGPAQRVAGALVTWQLFPMLGANPVVGRLFTPDDTQESGLVVLSHGAWIDRFGGAPDAVGSMVTLNDARYEIVGILPADFELSGMRTDFWLPWSAAAPHGFIGNHGGTRAMARLAEGVDVDRARAEVTGIFQEVLPADHGEHVASVFPRHADETREARPVILVMLAGAVLLLLVACGNAAALLLGAGIDRESEFALRGAVGASRGRIASQLLVESSVLASLSVVGGVVAAIGLSELMLAIAPTAVPGLDRAELDFGVLGFAATAAVLFGIGFGMIPAVSVSGVDASEAMGPSRGATGRRARLQSALVVAEVGMACTLVASGLLLTRTVGALDGVHPGFDYDRLAAVAVAVPEQRFRDAEGEPDEEAYVAYERGLQDELAALPGVRSITVTSVPPFSDWRGNNGVRPDSWDESRPAPLAERRFVGPEFFPTTGTDIVRGRGFTPEDALPGAPRVVVVSGGLANLGWPGEDPIGRILFYWDRQATVVGVAEDVRDETLEEVTELAFYAPVTTGSLLVRTDGDPAALLPSIRDRIWSYDEDLPILLAESVPDLMGDMVAEERYRARLMGVFAGLAALLALLGIYGVTSRSVSRRTREIGIRVALGAESPRVWRLISGQAIRLGVLGAIAGVMGARLAGRLLESFLWGVSAGDPLVLGAILVGMPLFAVLAAWIPARRAMKIDPLEALRTE